MLKKLRKQPVLVITILGIIFSVIFVIFNLQYKLVPETIKTESITPATTAVSTKININTANAEELASISGIGKTKANAIIAYRKSHGAFENKKDILKVKGIGEKIYESIKDQIKVK
jgi:competence protein ComEA